MSSISLEQEAELKRQMYEKLSPRRRKFIDKIGYEQWDPFQKPLDPIDLRQDNNQMTTQELIRGFLQQVPEERYNDTYAKGAFEMALGVINENERILGMFDFACWYMRMLQDKAKLERGESVFQPADKPPEENIMSITQAKNVEEYIEEQKSRLAKHPTCANTRYNLGMAYLSKRMFTEAEKEFLAAVEESPKMAEAYVQLGGICLYREDMEGCLRYNLEAAKAQPFFAVPFANIGFVYMQRGEADKAVKAFKKALTCDPKFVQAHANLGGLHFMEGDFESAIKHSTKAIELEPNFGPAYHNLAMTYIEMEEFDKAIEAIDKAKETHYEVPQEILDELEPHRKQRFRICQRLCLWTPPGP